VEGRKETVRGLFYWAGYKKVENVLPGENDNYPKYLFQEKKA